MFCVKCGTQCSDNSKFCKKCGAVLKAPSQPVVQNNPIVSEPQPSPIPTPTSDNVVQPKPEKEKSSPVIISLIIAIVVAIVAILGILAYILFIRDGGIFNKENTEVIDEQQEQKEEPGDTEENSDTSDVNVSDSSENGDTTDTSDSAGGADVTDSSSEATDGQVDANDDTTVYQSWQEAYLDYIEEIDKLGFTFEGYDLIYVNDDDIPELALTGDTEASGCLLVTYSDGHIDELNTSRLWFTYVERDNRLCNSDGNSGFYYDIVYEIRDGKWREVESGSYGYGPDAYQLDDIEDATMEYSWDGVEVTESEYIRNLNRIFDTEKAVPACTLCKEEVLSRINNDKYLSEGHKYEFVLQDVTWEEAERICRNNGGYLATITCPEEFDHVVELMLNQGYSGKIFYVGATRKNSYIGNNWSYTWVKEQAPVGWNSGNGNMWHPNEPSYSGEDASGQNVDEDCVDIYYSSADGRAYLNDVSDDIIKQAPFYSGIVGFICEYDY